jgi:hypothetical protein
VLASADMVSGPMSAVSRDKIGRASEIGRLHLAVRAQASLLKNSEY